jgi:hypothetical protein
MPRVGWKDFERALVSLLREYGVEVDWKDRDFPLTARRAEIRVLNKPYDKIMVGLKAGVWGADAIARGAREAPMDAIYTINVPCRPSEEAKAELKPIKRGLFFKEVVDYVWEDGLLANTLNMDQELKNMISEARLEYMKVKPVKDGVEIEFKSPVMVYMGGVLRSRMELEFALPIAELAIAEKVAEHLRKLF